MENTHKPEEHVAAAAGHDSHTARQGLQEEALRLFQCKDGSLVTNPRECRKPLNDLAHLDVPPLHVG